MTTPSVPVALETIGYASDWVVQPGQTIDLMVSCFSDSYSAEIVRITGGGPRPDDEEPVPTWEPVPGGDPRELPGGVHQTVAGSYGLVDGLVPSGSGAATVAAWIWPTMPAAGRRQSVLAWRSGGGSVGVDLGLDSDGTLSVRCAGSDGTVVEVSGDAPLPARQWVFIAAVVDPDDERVVLVQLPPDKRLTAEGVRSAVVERDGLSLDAAGLGSSMVIGASDPAGVHDDDALTTVTAGSYNGKVDAVRVLPRALAAAELGTLAAEPATGHLVNGSADLSVELVNAPMSKMTGHAWTGQAQDWRLVPEQYGAVAFHDDDLSDAGWPVSFGWTVPAGTRSGMYAARLTGPRGGEEFVCFYVRPAPVDEVAQVVVVIPTFTYTIYSNFFHPPRPGDTGQSRDELVGRFLGEHREYGYSVYSRHRDGSGVSHVSWRRPMFDMKPWRRLPTRGNAGREVSGDLYLVEWLEDQGVVYDTITDLDLHDEGASVLAPYRAVLTGGHPEYTSDRMLDAFEGYIGAGGNLAYLGGNGFYWVTDITDTEPRVLEVRRGLSGSRTWTGEPGESHQTESGEPGGHWRSRGRAPQAIFGIGFCAQGGWSGAGYRRTEASHDPTVAFLFEGVDDEVIGDFGLKLGGAAGDELDRADEALGTPPGTLIVATSAGLHDDNYQHAVEEVEEMSSRQGGTESPDVRADVTYFETPAGGSVLSVGSIAWSASLLHNGGDNNVSAITMNMLREFGRRPAPAERS